jgi:hypothetical protein
VHWARHGAPGGGQRPPECPTPHRPDPLRRRPYDLIEVMPARAAASTDRATRPPSLWARRPRLDVPLPPRRGRADPHQPGQPGGAGDLRKLARPAGQRTIPPCPPHHLRRRSMRSRGPSEEKLLKALPVIEVGVCIGTHCFVRAPGSCWKGSRRSCAAAALADRFRVKARFLHRPVQRGTQCGRRGEIINHVDTADAAGFVSGTCSSLRRCAGAEEGKGNARHHDLCRQLLQRPGLRRVGRAPPAVHRKGAPGRARGHRRAFCMDAAPRGFGARGGPQFSGILPQDAETFFYDQIIGQVDRSLLAARPPSPQ